jgi:hypothetical protein
MDMMSGDPLERAADWTVALEQAAEWTIAAAAAALLWCGEDGQGILAHVAGSTPTKMASSRIAAAYTKRAFPEYAEIPLDEDIANCSESLDLAALPATVAPQWAARVREAMSDTQRRLCGATWYGGSPSEPVVESEKRKRGALQIISMWGVDCLPTDLLCVDAIEATARAVTQEGLWVPLP